MPPTEMAAITKSVSTRESRWSVVLFTVSALPSLAISLSASDCITPSRPSFRSISVTAHPPSDGDCSSRRIRIGTKLLLPPPMMVTLSGMWLLLLVHRVVGHGQDGGLEHAVRARPGDGVDDGVGDLL